jgi:hypothetical protein
VGMLAAARCYEFLRGAASRTSELSPASAQPMGVEGPIG